MKKEKLVIGKVYVLAIEYNLNGSEGLEMQAFNDIKKARLALKKDYEEIVKEYDYDVKELTRILPTPTKTAIICTNIVSGRFTN